MLSSKIGDNVTAKQILYNKENLREFKEIYDDFYMNVQPITKRESSTYIDMHVSKIGQDLMQINSVLAEIEPEGSVISKSKEYDHFKKPFKHVKDVKK